ncbi:hypothetical protein [Methylotuvimicrobium alcaliphilum]|uniref:hypothetical protein n=1 Tax=Methylotuvimicrobium alcaliphilum TaxID=271065 RepID=UPI0002D84F04|nr:hypothetical protein [Methylotuvimicrobium alcaliphilum]
MLHHFTAYRLPLTAYRLPLTAYRLPLTAYRLPLTAYRLPLTAYRLPLTAHAHGGLGFGHKKGRIRKMRPFWFGNRVSD